MSILFLFFANFLMLRCFLMPSESSNVARMSLHMASARAQQKCRNTSDHELKDSCYYAWNVHQFSAHILCLVNLCCEA